MGHCFWSFCSHFNIQWIWKWWPHWPHTSLSQNQFLHDTNWWIIKMYWWAIVSRGFAIRATRVKRHAADTTTVLWCIPFPHGDGVDIIKLYLHDCWFVTDGVWMLWQSYNITYNQMMILILIVINLHVTRLDFTLDCCSLICSRLPPRAPELFAVVEHLFTDWRTVDGLAGIA